MTEGHKLLFSKVRKAQKLIEEARKIAKEIGEIEGFHYGYETNTADVLERYYMYKSFMDIEEYWKSSTATC